MEKFNNEQIKTFSAFDVSDIDVSDIETDVSDRNMKFIILPNGMLYGLNDRLNFCIGRVYNDSNIILIKDCEPLDPITLKGKIEIFDEIVIINGVWYETCIQDPTNIISLSDNDNILGKFHKEHSKDIEEAVLSIYEKFLSSNDKRHLFNKYNLTKDIELLVKALNSTRKSESNKEFVIKNKK